MAKVSVKFKSVNPKYKQFLKQYEDKIKRIVKFGVNDIRNFAVTNIAQGVKSGTVRRDGSRRSAEGEFPATDTGFLISNINGILANDGLSGVVESNAKYSEPLEFGTSNMGARPFLQPSLEQTRPKIKRMINQIKAK